MLILVCGGAGYVGSHVVRQLCNDGHRVVVFDDLSTGHAAAVADVPLVRADLRDAAALDAVFAEFGFDAVMHFCAISLIEQSLRDPQACYANNIGGSDCLFAAMQRAGVPRIVFSSSASVYGESAIQPITEDRPPQPNHPYGRSKHAIEQRLQQLADAAGMRSISLRYFNAAGASLDGRLGEAHDPETHLVPNMLAVAAGRAAALHVHGDDYPTPDGTCIRDYVHVVDLAHAHVLALAALDRGPPAQIYNLGSACGHSVLDVVACAQRVTGRPIAVRHAPRRAGDPAMLIADSTRARRELGWMPRYSDLDTIVSTAWQWHCAPRYG